MFSRVARLAEAPLKIQINHETRTENGEDDLKHIVRSLIFLINVLNIFYSFILNFSKATWSASGLW